MASTHTHTYTRMPPSNQLYLYTYFCVTVLGNEGTDIIALLVHIIYSEREKLTHATLFCKIIIMNAGDVFCERMENATRLMHESCY